MKNVILKAQDSISSIHSGTILQAFVPTIHVAFRKALAWLGYSSSQMLDMCYHLYDEDSQKAMMAFAKIDEIVTSNSGEYSPFEGNLRATFGI